MNDSTKKVSLVTGGAGFIGSHLVEELLKEDGREVISLDNYSTGKKDNHIKGARYIEGDTNDIERLVDVKPDIIFHLGEYARTSASFKDMEKVWRSNVDGTFRVFEFARTFGVKVVYAGSSTKFGDLGSGADQSPYAWTKARNTELLMRYSDWFGLPYVITYFYNVYGEREISSGPYATLIGIFQEKHEKGEPFSVISPGTQRRGFTYVKDIVRGLVLAGEKGKGDGYCFGTGHDYTILEVARMFGDNIEMLPERPGDRKHSTIDLTLSRDELGWSATKHLDEYIQAYKTKT